jgi:hypothetical protein
MINPMILAILIVGMILLALGLFILFTTHVWLLVIQNSTICSITDNPSIFIDKSRVIKEYFCHSV